MQKPIGQQQPYSHRLRMSKSPTFPMPTKTSSASFHLHNCSAGGLAAALRREGSRKAAVSGLGISARQPKRTSVSNAAAVRERQQRNQLRMVDMECSGFEPQNYLKERCKKCFRLREKHEGLSPLRRVSERSDDALLISQKGTPKRTQSIPTALRRVPVQRYKEDEHETKEVKRKESALEERRNGPSEAKQPRKEEKPTTSKLIKYKPPVKAGEEAVSTGLPVKSRTTTVLLPKQRQISLGSANASKPRKREEDRNVWQFLSKDLGGIPHTASPQNGGPGVNNRNGETEEAEDTEDLLSLSSYRTANSRGANSNSQGEMFSARSIDSLNSLSYAESFKTGKSPPFDEDDPFVTPTSTDAHFFTEGADFDVRALTPTTGSQLEFNHLRAENQRLAEQCRRYRHERRRWTEWLKRQRGKGTNGNGNDSGDGKRFVDEALNELELMVSEYREENSALKSELERVRDREVSASVATLNACTSAQQQQLEERLHATEAACEQLKKEREELEQELEEMQDQYRVEEIEEFRELQRELEQNAKNCRILQFKLRKSERQREQLQTEKNLLAKKFQEVAAGKSNEENEGKGGEEQQRKVAELEQELRVAKEISVKLHSELEAAEERRYRLEDELFYNKEKVRELLAQNKWREAKNSREQQTRTREVLSGERPEQELHREVRDSLEREADLREQLRFTESDLQRTRHRLRELELENDELLQKYTRLADQQAAQQQSNGNILLTVPKRPNLLRSISEGSEAKSAKGSNEGQLSPPKLRRGSKSEEGKALLDTSKDSAADAEQLCYMLAAMDAQANRICKQLEKLDSGSGGKEEKRRSLKGDIMPVLEELGSLLAEMKAIKEQLAKSQNISLTTSMIVGSVMGDNIQKAESQKEAEAESSCSECEDSERKLDELKESCDFYKRKNAELTEQVLQMKDQWAEQLRQMEDEAEARTLRVDRDLEELRVELDERRLQANAREKALEECRAELAALGKRLSEANLETERAKERAIGVEKELEAATKWEARSKEMKAERIRLQAEVAQLKRRTDEAVQELEKMRLAHQQKEIGWIREKLKLEEQLKLQKPLANGRPFSAAGREDELKGRIAELEKEKERLVKELAEGNALKAGGDGKQEAEQSQQTQRGSRPLLVLGNGEERPAARPASRVDYKQIADNALKAAESLQRQYREYQRQYTAEVQRLNSQLGQLEKELADRERRLREQQQQAEAGPSFAMPAAIPSVMPMQIQIRRAMESPSMSSLTENTTWDSRLLDCSMTRSISPFKFTRGTCPMMQCRTVEIHPSGPGVSEAAGPDFGSEEEVHREYRRTGSSGTNILYRIRREELSKGKNPSVRQMAKAFESFEKVQQDKDGKRKKTAKSPSSGHKKALFGLLGKAGSLEQQQTAGNPLPPSKLRKQSHGESPVPSEPGIGLPHCSTLPRGGRNPFKGMGSRIVERVRRSLSRSKKSQSRDGTPSLHVSTMTGPPEEPMASSWK